MKYKARSFCRTLETVLSDSSSAAAPTLVRPLPDRIPRLSPYSDAMSARLTLRNATEDLPRLFDFAGQFCDHRALPRDERSRLMIILDELFTNAVAYGFGDGDTVGRIDVALYLQENRLTVEFVDNGRPFDPLAVAPPDVDLPLQEQPIGGRGIAIVRGLVDEASYERDGNRNRLILRRKILPSSEMP